MPALLLCPLVSGLSRMIAAVAPSLGLFDLPVFHSGGGLTYVLSLGSVTAVHSAAWLTGRSPSSKAWVISPPRLARPSLDW